MTTHATLGLLLVREGLISRAQLYDALRLQRQTGRQLGTCLLSLGHVGPDALLAVLSRQLAIPALPPGSLGRASPEAVRRVPRDVAFRLRILPYSWDGEMLGVAVADGRVLGQLQEVAYHARAAVGAYVALEAEIEDTLRQVYPGGSEPQPALAEAASGPMAFSPPPPRSPEARPEPLERMPFFDAIAKLYESRGPEEVGCTVGRALLNYFSRVLVLEADSTSVRAVGCGGLDPRRREVPASSLPLTLARLAERPFTYGQTNTDVRPAELAGVFGFEPGATALLAAVGARRRSRLVVLADNGGSRDLYEDLHDLESLFKEAETGLSMLLEHAPD